MSIIVLSSCSGLLGAVGPHRRPVEPGEGGELGGGEGVLVQLDVLQTVPPPGALTASNWINNSSTLQHLSCERCRLEEADCC